MHYDSPISEKELPNEESSGTSDTKKLTCTNNRQLANNSVEKK